MEVHLKCGKLEATAATMGGELISLKDEAGIERIWWGDPAVWSGRNPLLFPIVGRLKNDTTVIDGREYHMNQHGVARKKEFTLAAQGENFAEFRLEADEETLARYPFRFALRVRHTLTEVGFETAITVENADEKPMPFCVGAHTGFTCPVNPGETFEDYLLRFPEEERAVSMPFSPEGGIDPNSRGVELKGRELPLTYDYFDRLDTVIFEGLQSRSVELVHRETGHGVRLEFPGFPMLAFWSKPGAHAPYLCMEPWQGCAWRVTEGADFTDKAWCETLMPGESKTLAYTATLI